MQYLKKIVNEVMKIVFWSDVFGFYLGLVVGQNLVCSGKLENVQKVKKSKEIIIYFFYQIDLDFKKSYDKYR